jgi:hypothetical protein
MKTRISAAVAFALLAATAAHAQSPSTTDPNGPGQSARCDTLTGAERDQCLRDENTKTQSAPEDSSNASTGSDSSAPAGASAPAGSEASSSSADKPQDATGDKLPATKSE